MAVDFQVVFPQEAVNLSRIDVLPETDASPRIIDVIGEDFRAVDEVLINRAPSPDVVILNKTRLVAQVPDGELDKRILTVSVLSRRLTVSPKSILRFRISKSPGKVSGILRLVQKFLKILLQSPGSDQFNRSIGGGALRNIGVTFSAQDGGDIVNNLVIAVDTTKRQIISLQSRNPSIPPDERLLSAKIITAGFNKEESAVDVAVMITSQAGRSATANLEI